MKKNNSLVLTIVANGWLRMKKLFKLLIIFLMASSLMPMRPVNALNSYPSMTLSATQKAWQEFTQDLKKVKLGNNIGDEVTVSLKATPNFKERRVADGLVIEVGEVARKIVEVSSSDPKTVAVSIVNDSKIRLKRGSGINSKVSISIKYRLFWKFSMRIRKSTSFNYYTENSNNYKPIETDFKDSVNLELPLGFLNTKDANYVLGEKWNTDTRSRMMRSATDSDGADVQYADNRIGAIIPDKVSKAIQNDRIDTTIKSPVELFFDSKGGRVTATSQVTSNYGNTVGLRGLEYAYDRDAAGAFALIEEDGTPKIVATSGNSKDNDLIHSYFPKEFYAEVGLYRMNNQSEVSLVDQKPTISIDAKGDDKKQDFLDRWGNRRTVSANYGDIFKAREVESKIGYTQNSKYTSLAKYQQPKEIYFEVTKGGYQPLAINQLESKKISVQQNDSKEAIDKQLQNTIDIKGNKGIKIEKFSKYPDVSSSGEKKAQVIVSQTLSSGKKVTYPYEVSVKVTTPPGKLVVKSAEFVLGEEWNATARSRLMESAIDSDGTSVSYFDGRIGSTIPEKVAKATKNGRIDTILKAPVDIRFASKGGTISATSQMTVNYGNTVTLHGYEHVHNRDAAGAFALIDENGSPKIVATSGGSNDDDAIHSYFPKKFYAEVGLYNMHKSQEMLLTDKNLATVVKANGDDKKQDFLDRWGKSRALSVNYGDILKVKQAEAKIGFTQDSKYTSLDKYQQPKEIYFEITKQGYVPLKINQLTFKTLHLQPSVKQENVKSELQAAVAKNGHANIALEKIVRYPDTTQNGFQETEVQVSEKLASGKKVAYTYVIPVIVKNVDDAYNDQFILSANNMTIYADQIASKTSDQLEKIILTESKAKAWKKGKSNVSEKIKVVANDIKPKFGTYQATLATGKLNKKITVNVLAAKATINLTIPKSMVFGSTDVQQGKIISPKYKIQNHSKAKVKVVLDQVMPVSKSAVKLLNTSDSVGSEPSARLFLNGSKAFVTDKVLISPQTAKQPLGTLDVNAQESIQLSGQYFGDFAKPHDLKLNLIFKFEILP